MKTTSLVLHHWRHPIFIPGLAETRRNIAQWISGETHRSVASRAIQIRFHEGSIRGRLKADPEAVRTHRNIMKRLLT